MKNILVLTDFSPNAIHTADAALIIAQKLALNILLYDSYFSLPLVPANKNDAGQRDTTFFKKKA